MIYLDNAATTRQKPQPVIDAVVSAMTTLGNSARGTHEGSLSASRMIYGTREKLATFFNCPRPDHVVFTANSTEALNMAICGLLDPGDHVIATDLEHNSVLRPLYRLEAERSVSLSFVPADRQGRIDYGDFERLIRPETPGHRLHPCLQPHRKRRGYWPGGGHRLCPRPDLSCGRLPNGGSLAY